jgi:hypothetical protein
MREPKLGIAVGKKGVGKSYATFQMMKSYINGNPAKGVKPRRVLIVDVNDEYGDAPYYVKAIALKDVLRFSVHPKIEIRRIRPFKDDGTRMTLREISEVLFYCLQTFRGGLLLIEDLNRYISDHLPKDLEGAICTNRHTDTDIMIHLQSIGRITSKFWQNINFLRFHKNIDSVERHQNKFPDKFELLTIVESYVDSEYLENDNKRVFVYVDTEEMKVSGKLKPKLVDEAIEFYVNLNERKLIKPFLSMKDKSGKPLHDVGSARKAIIEKLKKNYFTK